MCQTYDHIVLTSIFWGSMPVLQIQNWDLNKSSDLLQVPQGTRGRSWTSPTSMWFQSYTAMKQIILLLQEVSQSLTSSFWASLRQDLCRQIFPSGSACLGTGYSGYQSQKDWNQQGGTRVRKTGTNKEGRENRQGENLRFLFCTIYQNKSHKNQKINNYYCIKPCKY